MVVWTTWPDADLTLPSFSKVAPAELQKRKDLMVLRSYDCGAFKIKR